MNLPASYAREAKRRGLTIRALSAWHFRLGEVLDFWPSTRRWHRRDTDQRGRLSNPAELAAILDTLPAPGAAPRSPSASGRRRQTFFRLSDGSVKSAADIRLLDIVQGARLCPPPSTETSNETSEAT